MISQKEKKSCLDYKCGTLFKNETYYVVEGKNENGTDMVVWVGKDKEVTSEIAKKGYQRNKFLIL